MGNSESSLKSLGNLEENYVFSLKKPLNFARSNQKGSTELCTWKYGLSSPNKSFDEWKLLNDIDQLNSGVLIPKGTTFEVTDIIIKGTIVFPLNCSEPAVYPLIKIISSPSQEIVGLEMLGDGIFSKYDWKNPMEIASYVKMEQGDLTSLINILKETYEKEFGNDKNKSGVDTFINGRSYQNEVKENILYRMIEPFMNKSNS